MKILVLAGDLSPERNVSLSSAAMISEALRNLGHKVAMVDLFFGLECPAEEAERLFEAAIPEEYKRVGQVAPDLAQVRAARRRHHELRVHGLAVRLGPGR